MYVSDRQKDRKTDSQTYTEKQTNRHRQKRNCQEHFRDHHHLPVKDTKGWLVVQNGHAIKNQYHQKAAELSQILRAATQQPGDAGGEQA